MSAAQLPPIGTPGIVAGMSGGEPLKGHLDMLLLSVLKDAPAHGYAVIERVAEISEGAFELGEGTVYPALRRLEGAKLLRSHWVEVQGRDRRIYQVTAKGEKALAKQRGEWDRFSTGVRRILEAPG
jgi:PadR family transcriptional regulator, regulatory protein PadR